LLSPKQRLGNLIQRIVPTNRLEGSIALVAAAAERLSQSFGVIKAFVVTRHLRANDAGRVSIFPSPSDTSNGAPVSGLNLQRAGGRAIMRTNAVMNHAINSKVRGKRSF
jgi:hypothetical protein